MIHQVSELAGTVLAISALLMAVLLPLALVAGIAIHIASLAKQHGGPLEHDIPDAGKDSGEHQIPGKTVDGPRVPQQPPKSSAA